MADGRDVRKDGVNLLMPCFIELRAWINDYFTRRAYERGEAAGEKKGAGNAMARLLCWFASLSDADIDRIQAEGGEILAELSRLPRSYGKSAGRADPPTVVRRTASVFAPDSGDGPYVPPDGVRLVSVADRSGQHGADEEVERPEPDPVPRRRARR